MQNIVRSTEYGLEEAKDLFDYVLLSDWAQTPGFFWFDYDTEGFSTIPRHTLGHEDGFVYQNKPILAVSVKEAHQSAQTTTLRPLVSMKIFSILQSESGQ